MIAQRGKGDETARLSAKCHVDVADSVDSQKQTGSSDPLVRVIVQTNKPTAGAKDRR